MKKIPTVFERVYENHKVVDIRPVFTNEKCKETFKKGVATIKRDGACCAIINGEFYKRYDAKKGKKAPEGAIPCCEPDPVTGHHPHWIRVDENNPADKWFVEAYQRTIFDFGGDLPDGTYEALGLHFQGNPYDWDHDRLGLHGQETVQVERTFEGVIAWLVSHEHEGIVFWLDGEPVCKIKRTDFGLEWPIKR